MASGQTPSLDNCTVSRRTRSLTSMAFTSRILRTTKSEGSSLGQTQRLRLLRLSREVERAGSRMGARLTLSLGYRPTLRLCGLGTTTRSRVWDWWCCDSLNFAVRLVTYVANVTALHFPGTNATTVNVTSLVNVTNLTNATFLANVTESVTVNGTDPYEQVVEYPGEYFLQTLAGTGRSGHADGVGTNARFMSVADVSVMHPDEPWSDLFVTDPAGFRVRRLQFVVPGNVAPFSDVVVNVTTFVGTGVQGDQDGGVDGLLPVTLNNPRATAWNNESQRLFIADGEVVRYAYFLPDGRVTTPYVDRHRGPARVRRRQQLFQREA